jgi:hypothetical protein
LRKGIVIKGGRLKKSKRISGSLLLTAIHFSLSLFSWKEVRE